MKKLSAEETRQKIIGLGETSVKKSYYPLLQEKIIDLELKQKQLMATVRALEDRETELEQLLEIKNALLMEVNHRVKNNLQIIGSLLSLGSANTVEMFENSQFEKTKKRIDTISLIYQEFLFSENYSDVTLCALFQAIAKDVRADTGKHDITLDFDFPMDEVIMDLDTAIPLALIAHEVITNSFNYAFRETGGRLRISLNSVNRKNQHGEYRLIIADSGPGFSPIEKNGIKESFGMMLIEALVYQLGGEYLYENYDEGLKFILDFSFKE